MKPRIYKYLISIAPNQTITMPTRARVLHLAFQEGNLQLWAIVDSAARASKYRVTMTPTGGEPPDNELHIGTIISPGENFVWHFFITELEP